MLGDVDLDGQDIRLLFVILMVVFAFVFFAFRNSKWKEDFPLTLQEYLDKYPNAKTNSGIRCFACNSKALKNWGLNNVNSKKRMVSCHHCSTKLYRIEG